MRRQSAIMYWYDAKRVQFSSETDTKRKSTNCRKRLRYQCAEIDNNKTNIKPLEENIESKTDHSFFDLKNTRNNIRNGVQNLSKTFNGIKSFFVRIQRRFRRPPHGRYYEGLRTEHVPVTPQTAVSKQLLGRTPTKLYSPFSIESPRRVGNVKS